MQSCFLLLIRSIVVVVFYRSRCFHLGITWLYIYIFRKLSDIKESFAFSPGLIYILIIVTRAFAKAGFPWGLNKTSVRRRNVTSTTRILPSVFPRGLIEAINFQRSLGMRNLNKKAKSKWILEVSVKLSHRENGSSLQCTSRFINQSKRQSKLIELFPCLQIFLWHGFWHARSR